MSIDRWMDKEDVVHIYNGIVLSSNTEWNRDICSNVDEPKDYHTKWSKWDRETQVSYHITYVECKKYDINELIYKTKIDSQTWLSKRKEGEG